MKTYYVYIATNFKNTVLYTGVTDNISRRIFEHKSKLHPQSFTARYNIKKLVYVETTQYANSAIQREKQIKGYTREKKIQLIESLNPDWIDLLDCE
ncbi:MAG: GIY-YIG nuclease family protein [Clostridiales bacterium]|nr:GIY-YIG nuclease family protein [Clostridiales bacterium]